MTERPLMKDGLGGAAVRQIGTALAQAAPRFDRRAFETEAQTGLAALELKARVHHIIGALSRHLPADFAKAAPILARIPDTRDPLSGFAAWPIIDYVGVHGLGRPEIALETLRRLTGMFTAEFAVRPFFVKHYDLTYAAALAWTEDESEHVRRLASEGSRPRLPWGMRLHRFVDDPSPLVPLLDRLNDDPSDYVRRSVANNLNDISKDHPDVVVSVGKRWLRKSTPERAWMIRHATRSLVKAGHAGALTLLGYGGRPQVRLQELRLAPKRVAWNGAVTVDFSLTSTGKRPQKLVVDFAVHFVKASGARKPKVFKGRKVTLEPDEEASISWRHQFRDITTRAYHPGEHQIDVVVNGVVVGSGEFVLKAPDKERLR